MRSVWNGLRDAGQPAAAEMTAPRLSPRKRSRFANAQMSTKNLTEAVVSMLDKQAVGGSSKFSEVLDGLTDEFEQNVRPHKQLIREIVKNEYRRRRLHA